MKLLKPIIPPHLDRQEGITVHPETTVIGSAASKLLFLYGRFRMTLPIRGRHVTPCNGRSVAPRIGTSLARFPHLPYSPPYIDNLGHAETEKYYDATHMLWLRHAEPTRCCGFESVSAKSIQGVTGVKDA